MYTSLSQCASKWRLERVGIEGGDYLQFQRSLHHSVRLSPSAGAVTAFRRAPFNLRRLVSWNEFCSDCRSFCSASPSASSRRLSGTSGVLAAARKTVSYKSAIRAITDSSNRLGLYIHVVSSASSGLLINNTRSKQLRKCWISGHTGTNGQQIHEKADELFGCKLRPVCQIGAHDDILLTGQPGQQQLKARQQRHKKRSPVAAT